MIRAIRHDQVNRLIFVDSETGGIYKGVDGLTVWADYETAPKILDKLEQEGYVVDKLLPPKCE